MPVAKLIAPTTKQEIPKLRVAAYCRVSSNSADQRNSFATQERVYTKYIAEKQEWELVDIFADEGLSGMKADNRPEFQRMIKDSKEKLFDVVLVWKLDRFARNRYDSAQYKTILKKNGVRVVSANEAISETAEGILMESVLEGYAEYFSADLAEKVNRGMTENALKCKFNGGNPTVGYIIDSDKHFKLTR